MTFKEEYKEHRKNHRLFTASSIIMISSVVLKLFTSNHMTFLYWFQVVFATYTIGSSIYSYIKMKKAKGYIVFDDFLKKVNYKQ